MLRRRRLCGDGDSGLSAQVLTLGCCRWPGEGSRGSCVLILTCRPGDDGELDAVASQ